jgi:hypothetical protein
MWAKLSMFRRLYCVYFQAQSMYGSGVRTYCSTRARTVGLGFDPMEMSTYFNNVYRNLRVREWGLYFVNRGKCLPESKCHFCRSVVYHKMQLVARLESLSTAIYMTYICFAITLQYVQPSKHMQGAGCYSSFCLNLCNY